MSRRPSAYVSFKENDYGITIDFRVHARGNVPADLILNEVAMSYTDLIQKIRERWGDDKRKPDDS